MPAVLIKNATVITMDQARRVMENCSILVEGDRICAVGDGVDLGGTAGGTPIGVFGDHRGAGPKPCRVPGTGEDLRIIDASGCIAIPGLIQTHVHLCQALFRGMSDDMELLDWLRLRTWPLEAAHDEESIYYSALLGIAELLRGGTTCVVDMETVNHTESAFRAIVQSGIRAVSGKVMMDWGDDLPEALRETSEASLAASVELADKWDGSANGRLRYAFTPRFAVSCSDWLLREVGAIAKQRGAYIHTHSSENRGEIQIVQDERGARNVIYLDRVGLLGPRTILAHCIHLDQAELDTLKRTGTHVAHCPSSNLKLASGIAPVPEMLKMGINVSLGPDGAGGNNNLDQFVEMRMAALIHKPRLGPTAMPALTVLEMATLRGAAALGMEGEIGSIEPGKKADIVLLDLGRPHAGPGACVDPVSRVVYSAHSSDVVMTMVDGRVVYDDGRLVSIDERDVLCKCEECIVRLVRRAGLMK